MKSVIFGHMGFVGPHLEDLLKDEGHDVFGFDMKQDDDIRDYEKVRSELDRIQPDYIFHLAAMAFVSESNQNPQRAIDVHLKGTVNILEAVRQLGLQPKILLASTSEEYGYENQVNTVTEVSPIIPTTIYGATKAAMTHIARVYEKTYGMHIVVTRAFNHIGPGKGEQYADSSFAKRIVQIERGELDVLKHGNLEAKRNYTDVRDIVRAYVAAIECDPGVYNVCSTNNVTIQQLLDMMVSQASVPIKTELSNHLYKPGNNTFWAPTAQKLHTRSGWQPQILLEESIRDTLNDWRERLI